MTSRKVSHYFDEHPITIVSSAPLADILNNPGATGRVAEWKLSSAHGTCSSSTRQPSKPKYSQISWSSGRRFRRQLPPDLSNSWSMLFDGSKRQQGAGAGVVLFYPKGMRLNYVLQINFSHTSNNEAEY